MKETTSAGGRETSTRWFHHEHVGLFCAALATAEPGSPKFAQACADVMAKLPAGRRLGLADIGARLQDTVPKEALAEAKRYGAAQRAQIARRFIALAQPLPDNGIVCWSRLEHLLVARRIAYMQRDLGDPRSVALLAFEAQRVELPSWRWRKRTALSVAAVTQREMWGQLLLDAVRDPAELRHLPFDPKAEPRMPEEPPEPEPESVLEPELEPELEPAEPVPNPKPEEDKHESARSLADLIAQARAPAPQEKPQEPLKAIQAPTPLPEPVARASDPLRAFGEHLAQGLAGLMEAVTAQQSAALQTSVRQMAEQLLGRTLEELDKRMEQRVRTSVKLALDAALGADAAPVPEVKLEPLPDMKGEGLFDVVKLDILGLHGHQIFEVKKALNGFADSVRFIEPDKVDAWIPRDIVLINARMGLGAAERKCAGRRAHVHRYWGTAASALNAIGEIYKQQGLVPPHEHKLRT